MKKIISILFTVLLLTTSCENWLDVNDDPNNPSEVKLNQMLPGVYYSMSSTLGYQYMRLGYITAVYTHQLSTRESIDQYGINGNDVETNWTLCYGILTDINVMIAKAEETDNSVYVGVGKILKAYMYSQMVDLFGDIPFSQSNSAVSGEMNPEFESDEAIYTALFAMLEEGTADLTNSESTNALVPGNDDLIYGGDIDLWTQAANTIRLKLYVQARKTSLFDQAKVDAILADPANYISSVAEDFSIPFGTGSSPDDRNPAMVNEYAGSQISSYISPWFYEILDGRAGTIFETISDPRIPYYFANQLEPGKDPENRVEYRNGDFVSIYFGSTGPNRDAAGRKTFSMIGLYPVGGAFDSPDLDRSEAVNTDQAAGNAPHRLITAADVQYMIAELINDGKATGDQRATLSSAIDLSFAEVNMVATLGGAPLISTATSESYRDAVLGVYDVAADADAELEIIMTQKWIQKFGSSIDAYSDYRRTGYPVMFDPVTMAAVADGGPDGNGPVPVQSNNEYARRFPYSATELSLNSSAPEQVRPALDKVFWDK